MGAPDGVQAQADAMRKSRDLREAKDRETAQAQSTLLNGAVLRVEARAGKAGSLFGSVSAAEVADAVRAQKGVELNRHQVVLAELIKEIGTYQVALELFSEVSAVVTIEVVA